jgi:hypothetical protein
MLPLVPHLSFWHLSRRDAILRVKSGISLFKRRITVSATPHNSNFSHKGKEDFFMRTQVFLGGTAGDNHWREEVVIPQLKARGVPEGLLFNPIVSDWNEEVQAREDEVKRTARYMLFVISNPMTPGNEVSAYSLIEAVMALYDDYSRTVVALDTTGMSPHVVKAMKKGFKDLRNRFPDAPIFDDITSAVSWLAYKLLI